MIKACVKLTLELIYNTELDYVLKRVDCSEKWHVDTVKGNRHYKQGTVNLFSNLNSGKLGRQSGAICKSIAECYSLTNHWPGFPGRV